MTITEANFLFLSLNKYIINFHLKDNSKESNDIFKKLKIQLQYSILKSDQLYSLLRKQLGQL